MHHVEGKMSCPKTCAKACNIRITQKLLDRDAEEAFRSVGYTQKLLAQRITKGKDIALVAVSNDGMREAEMPPAPLLLCACDFHYEVTKDGSHLHYIDTFRCKRKEAWMTKRQREVGGEYIAKGITDPETIFLDLFRRVSAGEWVGQRQGCVLYLQEAAAIAGVGSGVFAGWGVGLALVAAKKISLNGAIMIPYREPPEEIPDHKRTPMTGKQEEGELVWSAKLDDRFLCEVQRLRGNADRGVLCIFDGVHGDRLLGWSIVGLSYGAAFGPDAEDVAEWRAMIAAHIDAYVYHKELPDERRALSLRFRKTKRQKIGAIDRDRH